ncbi:MAG: YihY/virulence factor BrkB family protein [Actinobacteria bacterium]|nr:MAG: YihY/virulence factor BrkB family protein [Actinomycetota bacterium]
MARQQEQPRVGLIRPGARPEPDEAPLGQDGDQPTPQPERREQKLADPGLRDLSFADYKAILIRAAKEFLDDNAPLLAQALAYSTFFAIPSVLLVVVGVFTLVAGPDTINSVIAHLHGVIPSQATELLDQSLKQLDKNPSTGIVLTIVGFVLALWATTGAMNAYMVAINLAYDRKDRRSFVRKRIVALEMVVVMGFAFTLVAALLIFGPVLEKWVGRAVGAPGLVSWIWWLAQWPILLAGLLTAFATLLYLGPDVDHPKWQFLSLGSIVSAVLWIAFSGLFAVYTSMFGSYNKTWGTLSAVIVMMTWLWLSAMALLFGAEVNAEAERSRELRRGGSGEIDAPAKS